MQTNARSLLRALTLTLLVFGSLTFFVDRTSAVDRLTGLHSAQVMSQSMPWIAQEAGLFKKYDLDFRLVFIPSSPIATAATLNGDAEIGVTGAAGNVRAYVQGFTDLVFIGGIKNILTHSVLGKPDIKRPEDLKGKKVGVGRFGGNTHYFVIQALKRLGMDASKDIQTIQTGGGPETLAALLSGNLDAAGLVAPGDRPPRRADIATLSTVLKCAFPTAPRNSLRSVQ
jgi:NitT/TauT family transport system substrate-binding protein